MPPVDPINLRDVEVIVANLKRRHTGVTSTIVALLPVHARRLRIAALGLGLSADCPRVTWWGLLRHGWSTPYGKPCRIWHARRNIEMLAGVVLRDVLRMPLQLVFTSAAQRRHTRWTQWLLRRMDAVIATSPEAAAFLEVPHTVILHGVNTSRYQPSPDRERAWTGAGLPGKYGVGVFGRVRAQKGTDVFVEAMCRLLPRYPDFTAVVIGAVTPEQAAFAQRLRARVAEAGLAERIVFLGEQPADEVPGWLGRMTVVVGPQRWEGFGLVPAEAMASGAAVVATRVGAAHHLVVEGVTGFLAPPEDLDALSDRIERLLRDPAGAQAMGAKGREHVLANLSVEREAEQIEGVYDRCWWGRER